MGAESLLLEINLRNVLLAAQLSWEYNNALFISGVKLYTFGGEK